MKDRRNLLKGLGVVGATGVVWQKPVVDVVMLPAHAMTSPCFLDSAYDLKVITETTDIDGNFGPPDDISSCGTGCAEGVWLAGNANLNGGELYVGSSAGTVTLITQTACEVFQIGDSCFTLNISNNGATITSSPECAL